MAEAERMKRTDMAEPAVQSAVGNPNQAAAPQKAIGSPSVSDKSPNLMQQRQQKLSAEYAQAAQRMNAAAAQAAQRTNAAANPDQAAALQSAQQELAAKQQALSSMQTTPAAGQAQAAVSRQYQAAPQNAVVNPSASDKSPNLMQQRQQNQAPVQAAPQSTTPVGVSPEQLQADIARSRAQAAAPQGATSQQLYGSMPSTGLNRLSYVDTREMEANLKAANEAAKKQQTAAIDQAMRSEADALAIAEREAIAQYDEQRRQSNIEERQAMDNAALYAAARGDRGGVGQAQFNAVQANAARNRASIGQAQTKMSSDIARQIAELRRQGEFKKADTLLTLSQQYLSQLNDLKRWATESNISIDQANNALAQWQMNFAQAERQNGIQNEIAAAGLTGMYNGQATMEKEQTDLENQRYDDETAYQRGQDAINNAIREAGLTGMYNGQKTAAQQQIDLENQRYEDETAYQRGQDAINNAIREAGLTGMYNGQKTAAQQQIDLENQRYEDETAYQRGQDAINNAVREAGLTGMYNGQKTAAQQQTDLENQRYEDETAYQRGQNAINNAIREAGLTGVYNGQKTVAQQQYEDETAYQRGQDAINNAIREAGLTGVYNGQKTVAQQQYEDETAYQRGQDAINMSVKQQGLDADSGFSLLEAGQMPNATQLKAMGWTSGQAQKYINDAKALQAATDAASAAGDTSKVATLGWKSLDAGIMPSKEQLAAMDMTSASAQAYIDRILKEESSSTTPTAPASPQTKDNYDGLFTAAAKAQSPENYIASHYKEYGFNSATGLNDAFITSQKKAAAQQNNPANVSMGIIDPATNRMITRADPRVLNVTYDSQGRAVYHLKDGRNLTDSLGGKDTSKIPGKTVATYLK
jgi:protein tyrosine phosphatase (PTP) superfamily phosphohydrolase (DUF442 family)